MNSVPPDTDNSSWCTPSQKNPTAAYKRLGSMRAAHVPRKETNRDTHRDNDVNSQRHINGQGALPRFEASLTGCLCEEEVPVHAVRCTLLFLLGCLE
jgi:hypothetical protein